jgi:hypothetical protein
MVLADVGWGVGRVEGASETIGAGRWQGGRVCKPMRVCYGAVPARDTTPGGA